MTEAIRAIDGVQIAVVIVAAVGGRPLIKYCTSNSRRYGRLGEPQDVNPVHVRGGVADPGLSYTEISVAERINVLEEFEEDTHLIN